MFHELCDMIYIALKQLPFVDLKLTLPYMQLGNP